MTVSRDRGELAILLHSHMPYVEGFGTWPFGEEWLFEAVATSYIPLLEVLDGQRLAARAQFEMLRAMRPAVLDVCVVRHQSSLIPGRGLLL